MAKIGDDYPFPSGEGTTGGHFTSYQGTDRYDPFGLVTISDKWKHHGDLTVTGILVHESVHAFQFITRVMGETHPSVEFEAYSIQNIYLFMQGAFNRTLWSKYHGKKKEGSKDNRATA